MAPVKQSRPRRTQDVNPYLVDTAELPSTPAMETLHELAKLAHGLDEAKTLLDELVLDATVLGLAEGQTQGSVMLAQGRDFSWRAQLSKLILRERGINIAAQGHYRQRIAGSAAPGPVPAYLNEKSIEALAEHIHALKTAVAEASKARKKQAPGLFRRAKDSIEGSSSAQAS